MNVDCDICHGVHWPLKPCPNVKLPKPGEPEPDPPLFGDPEHTEWHEHPCNPDRDPLS